MSVKHTPLMAGRRCKISKLRFSIKRLQRPMNALKLATLARLDLTLNIPCSSIILMMRWKITYVAAPIRLFVIDPNGKITYAGKEGPHLFDPDGWEEAIKAQTA